MSATALVLAKLSDAKPVGKGKWTARCPAHADHRPSLSVTEGDDGRVLIRCHAGCAAEAIVSALGLSMCDLMPDGNAGGARTSLNRRQQEVSSVSALSTSPKTYRTASNAVAELELQYGKRAGWWTYHDVTGRPIAVVVRWNTPRGKTIRPISFNGSNWIIGAMRAPRPLYHLPELADAERIFVAEGERTSDTVRSLGLTATTSSGGSNAANRTDWAPLSAKEITILPDHDPAGERYADDVAGILAKLTPTPKSVKVVVLPDLPPHGDAVEFVNARRSAGLGDDAIRAEIESLVDAATPTELDRPAPPVEAFRPFPVDALPEPVRSFVAKGAQAIGCDVSYIALPMLSALASAIGNTRRIQLKRGWTEPAILWTAIVGESGTLKTPGFRLVTKPIHDRQGAALKRHAEEQASYEVQLLRYEKELTVWKRSNASDGEPPEKPPPPQAERYIVSDTTVEALAPILLANPRGVLLARDELAGWVGSFDRYVGGKGGADAAHWLSMHNGESIVVDRKTGKARTIYVPSALVSITGGVQPGILDRVIGAEHRESGLLARLLLAMPPRRPKRWSEAEIPTTTAAAIEAIFDRLYELAPDQNDNGDPRPRIVRLTPEGKAAWVRFYNSHAEEHDELTGDLSAAWSKLEAYAARLALVVHFTRCVADDPTLRDPDAVDETSIAAGVALSRWFGIEARRVYAVFGETDDDRRHRWLVELIQGKGGAVSVRDWQRARSHKTAGDAEAELNELVEAGYGRWHVPKQSGPGRPSKRFVLASDNTDTDKNPADGPETQIVSVSEVLDGGDNLPEADGTAGDEWGEM